LLSLTAFINFNIVSFTLCAPALIIKTILPATFFGFIVLTNLTKSFVENSSQILIPTGLIIPLKNSA
jgi:hypothetical protein